MKNKSSFAVYAISLAIVAVAAGALSVYAHGNGDGFFKGNIDSDKVAEMKANKANMDLVKSAIENNDYQAFLEATADRSRMQEISEEDFAVMVEAHKLRADGDMEGARALMEEAGLKMGPKGPGGFGGHRMNFKDNNGDGVCDYLDRADQE